MMIAGTLSRYIGMRFLTATLTVFAGVFALVALVDYIEFTRRTADVQNISPWLVAETSFLRVPQVTERILPFSILIGAMSCYLTLSRRLELVVARAAGVSAWQFVTPAILVAFVIGLVGTTIYNPLSAAMRERAKRLEQEIFGQIKNLTVQASGGGFWVRQRSIEGHSIVNATASREQGVELGGVTAFTFDAQGSFQERIAAQSARLEPGYWRMRDVRVFVPGSAVKTLATFDLPTNLTTEQVRESFATPETVSFWELPSYIESADRAGLLAAGYRLQYQNLLARPFLLSAMVLLAAAVSLRFFRFGGVQKMVLSGVLAGFLLYVLSKITEDLTKAELMNPIAAAWLPVLVGALIGSLVLLYQEDG